MNYKVNMRQLVVCKAKKTNLKDLVVAGHL